jgi:hypothetical protein
LNLALHGEAFTFWQQLWAIGAVVAQLLYTQWVEGSNPSSPTNFKFHMKKIGIVLSVLFTASALMVFGQAEGVKKRAKDVKKNVETGQTNSVPKTNPPAPAK